MSFRVSVIIELGRSLLTVRYHKPFDRHFKFSVSLNYDRFTLLVITGLSEEIHCLSTKGKKIHILPDCHQDTTAFDYENLI